MLIFHCFVVIVHTRLLCSFYNEWMENNFCHISRGKTDIILCQTLGTKSFKIYLRISASFHDFHTCFSPVVVDVAAYTLGCLPFSVYFI